MAADLPSKAGPAFDDSVKTIANHIHTSLEVQKSLNEYNKRHGPLNAILR